MKIKAFFSKLFQSPAKAPQTGAFSLKGRKPSQEDHWFISQPKAQNRLAFVADGVGGHGHGDFASALTVSVFKKAFEQAQNFDQPNDFLRKTSLLAAGSVLNKGLENPEYKNCGTTISGFFVRQNLYYTLNIGDSRVYHYTEGKLLRKTKDHSQVQRLLDAGILSEQEAFSHPRRNMMTSAIGQPLEKITIDTAGSFPLKNNDLLLAFSDGVHDALTDDQIQQLIEKQPQNPPALARLIAQKAYDAGSADNITACVYWHKTQ